MSTSAGQQPIEIQDDEMNEQEGSAEENMRINEVSGGMNSELMGAERDVAESAEEEEEVVVGSVGGQEHGRALPTFLRGRGSVEVENMVPAELVRLSLRDLSTYFHTEWRMWVDASTFRSLYLKTERSGIEAHLLEKGWHRHAPSTCLRTNV